MTEIDDKLYCIGCGARLQTEDKTKPGYVQESTLKKYSEDDSKELLCKRCFRLRNYNEITDVDVSDDDFLKLLDSISEKDALVVNVVDIFDYEGSVIPGLQRFVGDKKILVVGNKVDLLPSSVNQNRLLNWLQQKSKENGIKSTDQILVSAVKGTNIDELMAMIEKYRDGKDVYVVGTTNTGKSTLINRIISSNSDIKNLITTSRFPGTTLDRIDIPLDDGHNLIDTPGIIHSYQLAHFLNAKDLKTVTPKKPLRPVTFQLRDGQTIFVAGLARFDFLDYKTNVTFYVNQGLPIHRTKTINADDFYERHLGDILAPPTEIEDFPKMKQQIFSAHEKSDIVIYGLGWVTIPAGSKVKAYVPAGVHVSIRDAII
ncbi:ribosome biogenesis GTPase YqeH [Companilactobacillus alimentarius]|uniref:Ribosome biogenesis GTPase YqeH n=1 Tax=Companilactobacillus alimentarius DSM 20249 TaxID=1423720 RepID=A0A2K9HID6_9LACO|nr:ribosome biogenesis GTPase YqeH [Companilactobacillus alimentarius]AUI71467.1 ribosome biogenesis GTPase YqeH [Companilactobacillus alimentarius DSM 20249]KRK74628.1 GTPase YqeH [Companilactobacillus alimentarius DSM 20249]MDT6951201.1 ribosome biogenesis GTPase YqeH [Companilactobacillus alimentarius]GEO44464.1 ribosome biogenesis GTPase YqeH [Companilactobacillus alimentarius]